MPKTSRNDKVVRLHHRGRDREVLLKLATAGDWDAALAFMVRFGRRALPAERAAIVEATIAKHPPSSWSCSARN
jgi:hypothetical protein